MVHGIFLNPQRQIKVMTSWSRAVPHLLSSWTRFGLFVFSVFYIQALSWMCVRVLVHPMAAAHGTYSLLWLSASSERVSIHCRHPLSGVMKPQLRTSDIVNVFLLRRLSRS